MSHTKGPWKLEGSRVTGKNKRFVCHLEGMDLKSEEGLANAVLIITVPKLLAAAKKMLEAWDCRHPEAGIVALQDAAAEAERIRKAGISSSNQEDKQVADMVAFLKKHSMAEADLDGLVHDTFSSMASGVNNAGLEGQVKFLLDQGVAESHIANVLGLDIEWTDREDQQFETIGLEQASGSPAKAATPTGESAVCSESSTPRNHKEGVTNAQENHQTRNL